jgi:hypothetical protein
LDLHLDHQGTDMTAGCILRSIAACSLLLSSTIAGAAETVTHTVSSDGKTQVWTIKEPEVGVAVENYGFKPHTDIKFQPGDGVTIEAGGCVQTGGSGKTWKSYVNPLGPNSDKYYSGTIWIPGAIGGQAPNVTRIKDALGPWGIPPATSTANLYLLLGYLDDNYSDNGYYSHDDGTDDQCKNSENAWVRITIVSGAGGKLWASAGKTAPYDLLSDGDDDNLIPLNPYWAFATNGVPPSDTNRAKEPTGTTLCSDGGLVTLAENGPDLVPCVSVTTVTSRDDANWWKTIANDYDPLQDTFAYCTHGNWGPATYAGILQFESKSTPFEDDDYSWDLRRTDLRGLSGDRDNIEAEFNSEETIEHFTSPWWAGLESAVNSDSSFANAKEYFGSKFSILTGLFGLDLGHFPAHSELHPVFAMAVRVKEDDPTDEHWAMFVRRFGDEGFCSSNEHYLDFLPNNKFVFHLPLLWGPNAVLDDNVVLDMRAEHSAGDPPTVEFVAGDGVYVTFDLPENPAAEQLIHGELHLKWDSVSSSVSLHHPVAGVMAPPALSTTSGTKPSVHPVVMGVLALSEKEKEEEGFDGSYARILAKMTKEQLQQFQQRVPPPTIARSTVILPNATKVVRLASRTKLRVATTRRPSVSSAPNPAKVARDQEKIAAIRSIMPPAAHPVAPAHPIKPVHPVTPAHPVSPAHPAEPVHP